MVLIFAGEDHHMSSIKSLIVVLTSATLTIFQQGNIINSCKYISLYLFLDIQ